MNDENNNNTIINNNDADDAQKQDYQEIIVKAVGEIQVNLAELTKGNDGIACSTKELSILVKEFETLVENTDKNIIDIVRELKAQIHDLHTEIFVLRKLPEKMQEQL